MMALIFIMLLIAAIFAWIGRKQVSLYFFGFSIILALVAANGFVSDVPLPL